MLFFVFIISLFSIISSLLFFYNHYNKLEKINYRLKRIHSVEAPKEPSYKISSIAQKIGNFVFSYNVFSPKSLLQLKQTLEASGITDKNSIYLFVGVKLLFSVSCLLIALTVSFFKKYSSGISFLICSGAFVVGLMAPDYLVKFRYKAYLKKLNAGIPDMLDMMVICAEAGLNLAATLERVQREITSTHLEIGRELARTIHDLRVSPDQKTALTHFGSRTGLPALKRLTMTLIQATQYGTPLGSALRSLTAELRTETLTRFEENAAKLPSVLTIVMILLIMPTIFIVILGPAILSVRTMMSHSG